LLDPFNLLKRAIISPNAKRKIPSNIAVKKSLRIPTILRLSNRGNCPSFEPLLDAFLQTTLNNSTEFQLAQELMKKYA
jgi:hypothetical protein